MNKKSQTIDTYNKCAKSLAKKFDSQPARTSDIEEVFLLINKKNPKVLELGCGSGRDALEILKRTNNYLGIDISEGMIKLAKEKVPEGNFEVADMTIFEFPRNLDIIFSVASLVHLDKNELMSVLKKSLNVLNPSGILRFSVKYADNYRELTKKDEFGTRTYYLYSKEDIEDIIDGYSIIKEEMETFREQKWLEVILRKSG
jgi:ubiquinone/menaquinone biosynthesis C-methylase UbiE